MTSENVMADVESLSVTMMDSLSSSLLRSPGLTGLPSNCSFWRSRPIPPLSGDLLRSSSAAAAPLVAPASSRDATRKRSGLLLEAVVNRWDMFASRF
jgi:hypothetical protein